MAGTFSADGSAARTPYRCTEWDGTLFDSGIDVRAGDAIGYRAEGTIRMSLGNDNDGRLYFSVNDDYLMDNSGDYRVTVTIRR